MLFSSRTTRRDWQDARLELQGDGYCVYRSPDNHRGLWYLNDKGQVVVLFYFMWNQLSDCIERVLSVAADGPRLAGDMFITADPQPRPASFVRAAPSSAVGQ